MHEQMKSLLALCVSLCPVAIDDRVSALISVSGKKLARIQKGDLQVQEELFAAGCPKFISPAMGESSDLALTQSDLVKQQVRRLLLGCAGPH